MKPEVKDLKAVAAEIDALRQTHGLTKAQLINEYPLLGDKQGGAYSAAMTGNMAKRNPVTMLGNFRAVLTALKQRSGGVADALYADLPHVAEFLEHVQSLTTQRGVKRLIVVKGQSGEGKSSLLRILETHRPGEVLRMTAEVGWRSFHFALGEMLCRMGVPRVTEAGEKSQTMGLDRLIGCAARAAELRERLLSRRGIVCLDEMQSVSGEFLTFIKDCINAAAESGAGLCFVIAAQDALWKRLTREAPEEMRQLKHNRLHLEYQMPGPDVAGAALFLSRRLGCAADTVTRKAAELVRMAAGGAGLPAVGGWAFLRNVADVALEGGIAAEDLTDAGEGVYFDMTGRHYKAETPNVSLK